MSIVVTSIHRVPQSLASDFVSLGVVTPTSPCQDIYNMRERLAAKGLRYVDSEPDD